MRYRESSMESGPISPAGVRSYEFLYLVLIYVALFYLVAAHG